MPDISEVKGHVDLLAHARAEKAKWAEIEKAAKAAIEEALGADDEGTIGGQVVVRRKEIKSNKLDQGLLKRMHPEVAAECTAASVSYRVDLVDTDKG
ncbi:hypothetical protein SEA_HAMMY_57 [Mycobacterium phage Hammy]|uniref:Uncharacterized protein n=2 Tax=Amginevirus TaxID=2946794 RepID=A0A222ZNQ0_9CAUD|nr:hypothetical protein I5G85_gp42 [Mycobacterium phage Amohnition]YP_009952015.1 hypothetical protein I5G86_gp42 [Mycobacterium phage DarthP]APD18220.1 hypothetical protein SEA_HAMMY_57 [Mycobacterium phage Hammy]ASR86337.1 hypothetical protein SEA_AMOHNITION_57 [Mycobacterium phage Amohnition]ASW31803.1 hypothetical protein SEA_DARTHP_57 [Mycobacterium phage DarthP]